MTTPNISEAAREAERTIWKSIPSWMTTNASAVRQVIQAAIDSTQAENVVEIERLKAEVLDHKRVADSAAEGAEEQARRATSIESLCLKQRDKFNALRTRAEAAERGFTLRGQTIEELNAKIEALESFQPMAEIERLRKCVREQWDSVAADKILTNVESLRTRAKSAERERDALLEYVKASEYWKIEPHDQKERSAFFAYRLKEILQPTQKGGDETCAPTNSSTDSGTQSQAASNAAPTGPTPSDAATPHAYIAEPFAEVADDHRCVECGKQPGHPIHRDGATPRTNLESLRSLHRSLDDPPKCQVPILFLHFAQRIAAELDQAIIDRDNAQQWIDSDPEWKAEYNKNYAALERELTAERAKSAELANSFGAELTAIQSLLENAGITGPNDGHEDAAAYSIEDAVEELIASRDTERAARVTSEGWAELAIGMLSELRQDYAPGTTEDKDGRAMIQRLRAARLKLIEKWESDTPGKPGHMLRALADTVARVCNSGGRSDPPSKHVEELGAERDRLVAENKELRFARLKAEEARADRDEYIAKMHAQEDQDQSFAKMHGYIDNDDGTPCSFLSEVVTQLRTELAKRPTYGALVAENKALRAELEAVRKERDELRHEKEQADSPMFSRRELLAKINSMLKAIEAAGLALEHWASIPMGHKPFDDSRAALARLAPWRQKPEDLPPAAKV